jgi:hypothetical protein
VTQLIPGAVRSRREAVLQTVACGTTGARPSSYRSVYPVVRFTLAQDSKPLIDLPGSVWMSLDHRP